MNVWISAQMQQDQWLSDSCGPARSNLWIEITMPIEMLKILYQLTYTNWLVDDLGEP